MDDAESSDGMSDILSGLAAGSVAILIGDVYSSVMMFLSRVLPARLLDTDGYGLLILGLTALNLLGPVAVLGLQRGLARNIAQADRERQVYLVRSGLHLAMGSSVVIGVALFLSRGAMESILDEPGLAPVLALIAVALPGMTVAKLVTGGLLRGLTHATERVLINNVLRPTLIVVSIVLLAETHGATGAAGGWAFALGVTAAVCLAVYLQFVRRGGGEFDPQYRFLLSFSLPLMVSGILVTSMRQIDNVVVGFFMDATSVAIYDASFTIAAVLMLAIHALRFLFMPVFSSLVDDDEVGQMERVYGIVTKWIVLLTLTPFLGIVLFSATVLELVFRPEFVAGTTVLVVLASGFMLNATFGPTGPSLISLGETRTVMYVTGAGVVVNLVVNVMLIPVVGALGAAVASVCSYTAVNFLYFWRIHQVLGIQPFSLRQFLPTLLAVAVLVSATALVHDAVVTNVWLLPFVLGMYFAVHLGLTWMLGEIDEAEGQMLLDR